MNTPSQRNISAEQLQERTNREMRRFREADEVDIDSNGHVLLITGRWDNQPQQTISAQQAIVEINSDTFDYFIVPDDGYRMILPFIDEHGNTFLRLRP